MPIAAPPPFHPRFGLWLAAAATSLAVMGTTPARAAGQSGLVAAAAASGRPRECAATGRRALAKGPSVWEVARAPNLQKYCDLLARAQAQLATSPEDAKAAAAEADKLMPNHASPAIVLARAAFALKAVDEAERQFARARALDPRSIEDAPAMHDLAKVLVQVGKRDDALSVYRALVPRIDLLSSPERRVAVLLEAAHTSMAVAAGDKTRLDEAAAYLREARQQPPTQLSGDVLRSLALVLDRSGDKAQADAALGEAQRAPPRNRSGAASYVAIADDEQALDALESEPTDRATAIKSWEAFLNGPGGKGPWTTAARARLDALKKGAPSKAKTAAAPMKPRSAKP